MVCDLHQVVKKISKPTHRKKIHVDINNVLSSRNKCNIPLNTFHIL